MGQLAFGNLYTHCSSSVRETDAVSRHHVPLAGTVLRVWNVERMPPKSLGGEHNPHFPSANGFCSRIASWRFYYTFMLERISDAQVPILGATVLFVVGGNPTACEDWRRRKQWFRNDKYQEKKKGFSRQDSLPTQGLEFTFPFQTSFVH